jgi:hypothetical protein
MMLPPTDKLCHHTGFKTKCRALVSDGRCDRWRFLPGQDPWTGQPLEKHGCVDDLVLYLQGTAAAAAENAERSTIDLRNMIFDPVSRRHELEKSSQLLEITGTADENHNNRR